MFQNMGNNGGSVKDEPLHKKRRDDWPGIKEVGVIAHLAKLHKNVNDTHIVTCG